MRVFISIDMEGVAGITSNSQREPGHEDYQWGRRLMAGEANAAITGAFDAGAKEVLVNDSHNTMDNLQPHHLDPRAKLLSGSRKPLSMVEGLSRRFEAALFIGYHAQRGTPGAIMDHTYSERAVNTIRINGQYAGETLINGLVAGYFGVPLILVSGDRALAQEVRSINSAIRSVVVKEAVTRYSAACDHPEVACEKIREGVKQALSASRRPKPLRLRSPYRFEVAFIHTHMADISLRVPGVKRKDGRTVTFRQKDYLVGFKQLLALMSMAYGQA